MVGRLILQHWWWVLPVLGTPAGPPTGIAASVSNAARLPIFCGVFSNAAHVRPQSAPTRDKAYFIRRLLNIGQTFTQALTASMATFSGALGTAIVHAVSLAASMATFSGAVLKQTSKVLGAGMASFSGAILKQTAKAMVAGMAAFAGALAAIFQTGGSSAAGKRSSRFGFFFPSFR